MLPDEPITVDSGNGANSDSDSLFGSPPPSPTRSRVIGRSPSPQLALPGTCSGSAQNVGTIALPGSHLYSELAVTPPAPSSLSGFSRHHELAQRPLAAHGQTQMQPMQVQMQFQIPTYQPPPPPPLMSRPPSGPGRKRKIGKDKEKSSTPRPAPPPISLPDPDGPPPQNFLRNQQALLGLAGLIGGVNPAHLSVQRRARGSHAENPIVIDDDEQPTLSSYKSRVMPNINPTQLPPPSNEEILAALMKQRDVYPVMESILKLATVSPDNAPRPTQQQTSSARFRSGSPATKRRKLAAVPAGAADWDVPYPFANGEGPRSYRTTWERERGKQLITQLVGLVKGAAQKAAERNYVQQQREPQRRSYYRPVTATYGLERPLAASSSASASSSSGSGQQQVLLDHSNGCEKRSTRYDAPPTPDAGKQQPSTPFDQLIASLLSTPPVQSSAATSVSTPSWGSSTPSESTPVPEFDQTTLDSWMSILEAFPPPNDNTLDSISSLVDITATNPPPEIENNVNTSGPDSKHPSHATSPTPASIDTVNPDTNPFPDFAIDPLLLAMSALPQQQLRPSSIPPTPTLAQSPMPSTSSLADPLTPNWDGASFPEPDIVAGNEHEHGQELPKIVTGKVPVHSSELSATASVSPPPPSSTSTGEHRLPLPAQTATHCNVSFPPSAAPSAGPNPAADRGERPIPKQLNKQDIVRRARERRRQLVAEIERAKVEIWEATIEQGVLANIAKDAV